MNQEIKDRWMAALRSGDYAQTNGYLQDRDGFCCLGVLCEIAVADGIVQKWAAVERDRLNLGAVLYGDPNPTGPETSSDTALPQAVMDWAGLTNNNPEVYYPKDFDRDDFDPEDFPKTDLASLNDDHACTFAQIADAIEAQL